jgi:hypothetical protein
MPVSMTVLFPSVWIVIGGVAPPDQPALNVRFRSIITSPPSGSEGTYPGVSRMSTSYSAIPPTADGGVTVQVTPSESVYV